MAQLCHGPLYLGQHMGPPYLDKTNNPFMPPLVPKRKVFISYYHGDQMSAQMFVNTYGRGPNNVLIPKALGLSYGDDQIQSNSPDYVMDQIRERYISDSTVQIVLVGPCTHSRRYIDWEIKRSLSHGNGLIGILIPPHNSAHLPERFTENWAREGNCYARYNFYPASADQLRGWIEDAYEARVTRAHLRNNARETWVNNHLCNVCRVTH
jgi:hypothetical protein